MDVGDPSAASSLVEESPSAGFLGCPECNTTKLMMPNLQLRFSTCCGRCMCVHCIDNRFKATKVWTCTLCQEPLQKKNFDVLQIEEQRFKTEVQHRQETNKTFVLELIDFGGNLREYNDYLETNADIVYSLTYGSKSEVAKARARLDDVKKLLRDKIDKSHRRRMHERADHARKERMGAVGSTWTPPVATHVPSFVLPQPDAATAPPPSIDEEKRLRAIPDARERNKAMWDLMEKRRTAGGFRREDDRKRSKQEATEGLWF